MKFPITTAEVARRYEVDPDLVRYWCQQGLIRATKRGRDWLIDPENLTRPNSKRGHKAKKA